MIKEEYELQVKELMKSSVYYERLRKALRAGKGRNKARELAIKRVKLVAAITVAGELLMVTDFVGVTIMLVYLVIKVSM